MDAEDSNQTRNGEMTAQEAPTSSEASAPEPAGSSAEDGYVSRSSTAPLQLTEEVNPQAESLIVEDTVHEVAETPAASEAVSEVPAETSRISTEPTMETDQSEILASSSSHAEQPCVLSSDQTEQEAHGAQSQSDMSAFDSMVAEADVQPTASPDTAAEQHAEPADQSAQQPSPAPPSEQMDAEVVPFAHATFVVPTENWKHLQIVPLATTAAEIKHSLCSNWSISESALSVKYNRQELKDHQSLASCGIQVCSASGMHQDTTLRITSHAASNGARLQCCSMIWHACLIVQQLKI